MPTTFAPVIVTYDKATYNPGDKITATVSFSATTTVVETGTASGEIKLDSTGETDPFTATGVTINETKPATGLVCDSFADSGKRVWTKVSDDGTTAIWTAIA